MEPVGPAAASLLCLLTATVRAAAGSQSWSSIRYMCQWHSPKNFAVMILETCGLLSQSNQQQQRQQQLTARRRRRQHFLAVINGVWSMNLAQVSAAEPTIGMPPSCPVHRVCAVHAGRAQAALIRHQSNGPVRQVVRLVGLSSGLTKLTANIDNDDDSRAWTMAVPVRVRVRVCVSVSCDIGQR